MALTRSPFFSYWLHSGDTCGKTLVCQSSVVPLFDTSVSEFIFVIFLGNAWCYFWVGLYYTVVVLSTSTYSTKMKSSTTTAIKVHYILDWCNFLSTPLITATNQPLSPICNLGLPRWTDCCLPPPQTSASDRIVRWTRGNFKKTVIKYGMSCEFVPQKLWIIRIQWLLLHES